MKRIANLHLAAKLGAVVIFAINLWLRLRLPAESNLPLGLSAIGILAIAIGAWLGGEMVYVKGMAVEAVEKLAKKVEDPSRGRRSGLHIPFPGPPSHFPRRLMTNRLAIYLLTSGVRLGNVSGADVSSMEIRS